MLTVYTKHVCPHCVNAKNWLRMKKIPFTEVNVQEDDAARERLQAMGLRTVPQIFIGNELFVEGGYSGLIKLSDDDLQLRLSTPIDLGTL
jgi:glutaredoxin